MKFKNILVPFDGSAHASRALALAGEIAQENEDATIHLMSVVYEPIFVGQIADPALGLGVGEVDYQAYEMRANAAQRRAREEMETAAQGVLGAQFANPIAYGVVMYPSPAEGIKEYAAENGCDVIVMGRRGLSGLRGLIGSVTQDVLARVDLPVLTVK